MYYIRFPSNNPDYYIQFLHWPNFKFGFKSKSKETGFKSEGQNRFQMALHFSGSKYVSPYIVVVKQASYSLYAFRDSLLMLPISGTVRVNHQYISKVIGKSHTLLS